MMSTPRRALAAAVLAASAAACDRAPTFTAPPPEPLAPADPVSVLYGDTLFDTDWSEYPAGAAPAGWTQRWDPTPWFTVADDSSATGGRILQWSATGQSRNRWALAYDGFGDAADQEVYTEFRVRSLGGGASAYYMGAAAVRVGGTAADEQGYALFFVVVPSTGARAVVLATWSAGAFVQLGSYTVDWQMDEWYAVRLEAVGTSIRARVWPRGQAEPAAWQLSATDNRYQAGRPGVSHHDNGTVEWDAWRARIIPPPPPPLPPPPPDTLALTFAETAAWMLPAGWTETSAPAASDWIVAADLSAPDGRVIRNTSTATGRHILRLDAVPDTVHDQEVLVRLRMADADERGPGIALRHTMASGVETAYVAYLRPNLDRLEINRFVGGAWGFVSVAVVPNDPGTWYWLRFRAQGTTLQARLWPDGAAEPAGWQVTATDATIGAGSVGLYTYEPNTVDFDLVSYASAGGTAPVPASGPPPVLAQVFTTPASTLVLPGGSIQFRGYGTSTTGDSLVLPFTWQATGGTIAADGVYTAGGTAGTFQVIGTHQGGTMADTSTVTILRSPLGSTTYVTTFAGYAPGTAPYDWTATSAPAGVAWSVEDDAAFADGRGLRAVVTSTGRHILRANTLTASADQEVLARIRMGDGDSRGPGVALRHSMSGTAETAYVAYFRPGNDAVEVNRFLGGAWSFVATASFVNDPGAWYWIRFRAEGTTLRVRVWADGTPEPAGWTITVTDTGIASGSVGAYAYEPNTVLWDSFSAASNGGTAPTP